MKAILILLISSLSMVVYPIAAQSQVPSVLSEDAFLNLLQSSPRDLEGKPVIMETRVVSISQSTSLKQGRQTFVSTPRGLKFPVDFSHLESRQKKVNVSSGKIELLSARTSRNGNFSNFAPEKTLLATGEGIAVKVWVSQGRIQDMQLASPEEVTRARIADAASSGKMDLQQTLEAEKIQSRIRYLEAKLQEGGSSATGTVFSTSGDMAIVQSRVNMSDSEKRAIQEEINILRSQLAAMGGR